MKVLRPFSLPLLGLVSIAVVGVQSLPDDSLSTGWSSPFALRRSLSIASPKAADDDEVDTTKSTSGGDDETTTTKTTSTSSYGVSPQALKAAPAPAPAPKPAAKPSAANATKTAATNATKATAANATTATATTKKAANTTNATVYNDDDDTPINRDDSLSGDDTEVFTDDDAGLGGGGSGAGAVDDALQLADDDSIPYGNSTMFLYPEEEPPREWPSVVMGLFVGAAIIMCAATGYKTYKKRQGYSQISTELQV